jgi:DNA-binding MarR family transcriptional regulator
MTESNGRRSPVGRREVEELRRSLRLVLRRLWRRRPAAGELERYLRGRNRIGPRHLAVLAYVAAAESPTVGQIARELGLSLPAASKLTTELESNSLVHRREHVDDRRRTVVELNALSSKDVLAWLEHRNRPLEQALDALTPAERRGFVKGLAALADALMEESAHGPLRPHDCPPRRRGADRDRPV